MTFFFYSRLLRKHKNGQDSTKIAHVHLAAGNHAWLTGKSMQQVVAVGTRSPSQATRKGGGATVLTQPSLIPPLRSSDAMVSWSYVTCMFLHVPKC
jgi:hypothetical protein